MLLPSNDTSRKNQEADRDGTIRLSTILETYGLIRMNFDFDFISLPQMRTLIIEHIDAGYLDFVLTVFMSYTDMAERTLGLNEKYTDRIIVQFSPKRTINGLCATITHEVIHAILHGMGEEHAGDVFDRIAGIDEEMYTLIGGATY